ncbi:5-formyltetrahydrofolate cyclo-ligase [Aliiglaciecola sp. M165]|uniref:5-formyltetrahydrofolate cyclo-ligase n=1 Tax=Aliiglaciecola sp. M165 TaxID=2593649 RepID=UPI0011802D93|nr:5-formyltetrahydrofolate cyclo-ligase [Aliiglaciecola sp. M165]TRY30634.1 5-formyltetrahydrofolate cyclo-ligase [Aliiglaciecola sp. M165]
MSYKVDKIALRQHFRVERRKLTTKQQLIAAERVCEMVKSQGLLSGHQTVSFYLANDGELNCDLLIKLCWQQSIKVALPVIHPFNTKYLAFMSYSPESTMLKNTFGILEPKLDVTQIVPLEQVSAVFMPLVAFDKSGNRLGMGGGFYDRTLAALSKREGAGIPLYGIAHDCQEAEQLNVDTWDIGLNKIITPTRVICPRK